MTPTGRLGGLTLSVFLHAGAILALLSWSGTEWTHPLFVDLLERPEQPTETARPGEPAEARRAASPPGSAASAENGARRRAPAAPRPAPEAVAPVPSPAPPPMASPTPVPPPPVPEPPRVAAPSAESAPAPMPPTTPSAPPVGSEAAGSSSGSRTTDAAGGDTAPAASSAGGAPGGGSPLARSAPGGGGGTGPGEYGPYLARFRQRVQESLIYPLAARRQGAQGTVELDVLLEASGRVRDVRLVRSSTNALLDEAALETIRHLGAVPFPDSLPRRPLLIRLPLVFELR